MESTGTCAWQVPGAGTRCFDGLRCPAPESGLEQEKCLCVSELRYERDSRIMMEPDGPQHMAGLFSIIMIASS